MRRTIWFGLVAIVVVLGTLAGPAAALNVTGTWIGTLNCDVLVNDNPRQRSVARDQSLKIVMTGGHQLVAELNGGPMAGLAIDDGRNQTRGEVAAQFCTGSLTFNGILALNASVNDTTGTGTLSGEFIQLSTSSTPFVFVCRASFRRTDPTPPTLGSTC
jgi:hypothetical protein